MMHLSMIQPNKQARRLPVLLSLFAIMAIYIVPLIAQLNMQAHGMSGMHMDSMMMHHHLSSTSETTSAPPPYDTSLTMTHAGHTGSDKTRHDSAMPDSTSDDELGLKAACGFCTLLFHLQWLAILSFVLPTLKPSSYPSIHFNLSSRILKSVYSRLLPRAPPIWPSYQVKNKH